MSESESSWTLPAAFGGSAPPSPQVSGPAGRMPAMPATASAPPTAWASPGIGGGAATDRMSSHSSWQLKDPKLVDKPEKFGGEPSSWRSWNFRFQNWLSTLDARFPAWLAEV